MDHQNLPAIPPGKSLIIKGLCPGLTERGKIKIGRKGQVRTSGRGNDFQPPQKLDHFLITTMERGNDGNFLRDDAIHRQLGEKPREIPVRLLYDDLALNFQCRYACFNGKTLWCSGDGEAAFRLNMQTKERQQVSCPCGRQDPEYQGQDKCKINGVLSVMIDGVDRVGGVWKLRTTSYNTVVGILSSLTLIKRISGGPLAGLPLKMTLNPKTVIAPNNGAVQTIYVVGLEYQGSVDALQKTGYQIALNNAQHHQRIEHIEREAIKLLTAELVDPDETEADDLVAEFYPEQAAAAAGADYRPEGAPPVVEPPQKTTPQKSKPTEEAPPVVEPPKGRGRPKTAAPQPKPEPKPEPEPEPEVVPEEPEAEADHEGDEETLDLF